MSFNLEHHNTGLIPIFIVGMPRSGTTLIEQIISSHPSVTGAGELPFVSEYGFDIAVGKTPITEGSVNNFRRSYFKRLDALSHGKKYVTDKMPLNFRYLPLLETALPEAKFIHVFRDPAATCWSNYRHYFVAAGLGYSLLPVRLC